MILATSGRIMPSVMPDWTITWFSQLMCSESSLPPLGTRWAPKHLQCPHCGTGMSSTWAITRRVANGHCSDHPGAPGPADVECDIPPTLHPEQSTARGADVRPRIHTQYNATTFYVPVGWDEFKHLVRRRVATEVDTGRVLADE